MHNNDAAKRGPQNDAAKRGPSGGDIENNKDDDFQRAPEEQADGGPAVFPSRMNRAPGDEGDKLRHQLILMLVFHVTFLILFEVWLYDNFVFFPFIMQFVYMYVAFVGMMSLNKLVVWVYILLMFASPPLYFWLVIGKVGGFFSVVFLLIEMAIFFYVGGFITCRRLSFMNETAPGWKAGSNGTQNNSLDFKLFFNAIGTIFTNPMFLKSNADEAKEFWDKLGKLGGAKYNDEDFPADKKSLITDWREVHDDVQESAADWGDIEWIRAQEIPELNDKDGALAIFADGVDPNDIQQRTLGDCYFLSVLAALAEKESRVRKLFVTTEINSSDIYGVKCTKNGEQRLVTVDGCIPCKRKSVCFSSTNGNELWVLLLEKVWAKLHGDYCKIIGGLPHETFRDMTGAPGYMYQSKKNEVSWDMIKKADKEDFMLAGGIAAENQEEIDAMQTLGLISGHAYSVIAALDVIDANGKEAKIVQVRNPWGSGEWLGDWSDSSPIWSASAKKKAKLVVADDGTFWMCYDDFQKYFAMVFISTYKDEFVFNSLNVPVQKEGKTFGFYLFQMNVPKDGHYTIAISQKDKRCLPLSSTYQYSHTTVSLIKETAQGGFEHLKTEKTWNRDAYLPFDKDKNTLKKGKYWVYVKMQWDDQFEKFKKEMSFVINNYGCQKVTFMLDETTDKEKFQQLVPKK